jgi:SAM-dependent methyltransferase
MDRKGNLLFGLDIQRACGIEIGPLASPIVAKQEGSILYVDYAYTDFLRNRYKNDPNIDISKIVSIDAVWGEKSLSESIGRKTVDYVIASHVIEHVPDFVTWLSELHSVLNKNGQVRLAIPDKRYSFDYLRQESRLSDILAAHVVRARVPQPHEILDFCLNKVSIDTAAAWRKEIDPTKLMREFTLEGAMWLAQDVIKNGTYHDVHCWVFTPNSFAKLCHSLAEFNLLKFACHSFIDTARNQLEFFVALKDTDDHCEVVDSWATMISATSSGLDAPQTCR